MKTLLKKMCLLFFTGACFVPATFGFDLIGNVDVHRVSDTAANAKINAMDYARRQILFDILSQYSDKDYLKEVLDNSSDDDLADLIISTSVSNEQISSDAYSANISMHLDNKAVKKWLNENSIQNWIPSQQSDEKFTAFIVVQHGIADWAELKRIARSDNADIEIENMAGNQIFVTIPLNYRSKFTASIRNFGWKYTDNNGVLQIWK